MTMTPLFGIWFKVFVWYTFLMDVILKTPCSINKILEELYVFFLAEKLN